MSDIIERYTRTVESHGYTVLDTRVDEVEDELHVTIECTKIPEYVELELKLV